MINAEEKLIYKKESYEIIGMIFEVYNALGYGYKEKVYQSALEEIFLRKNILYKRELRAKVKFRKKVVGELILDFLVFDKIIIEIKRRNYFSKKDIEQIYSYLRVTGLKLGILVHITSSGVKYKRIINLK